MFFNRINFKIGFLYASAFVLSAVALYGLTAYLLLHSLQVKDRDLLTEKLNEYSELYSRDGTAGLKVRVSSREIKNAHDFVVRLSDVQGKTLFIHAPERSDDDNALLLTDIDKHLKEVSRDTLWLVIPGHDFGDDIEIATKILPSGETLQVGKDTEDREAFFHSFTNAYLKGIIPIFILALLVGSFLSKRLLRPIRVLTQTVESIRSGNPKARVTLHKSEDELRQLGQLFNQMLEQNERLVQGMKDTVDNVAHDLRTPVMRLQNSVESALRGQVDIEKFREALIDCQENSELLLKLLNGIMDISEAEAGTLQLKKETFNTSELIEGVADLYGFVAEDKAIRLSVRIINDFKIAGDRMRLLQAISNLVDNAIKYSPPNSQVTIESLISGTSGVIRVTDQGIGIPKEEQTRIWDRLYRLDSSRSSRGLGLGLSLVRAIVIAHDGQIGVESNTLSSGTTFFIKFSI